FTWFAGFDYPTTDVRRIWQELADQNWHSSLQFLFDGSLDNEDMESVEDSMWVLKAARLATGRSGALTSAILAARVVPNLPSLPTSELQDAMEQFIRLGTPEQREKFRGFLKP